MDQNSKERVDALHIPGLSIIQNKEYFCYGIDAVLLAHFATKYTSSAPGSKSSAPGSKSFELDNAGVVPVETTPSQPATTTTDTAASATVSAVSTTDTAASVTVSVASSAVERTPFTIVDLCTGNAIVPIIMSSKAAQNSRFIAVELQPQIADLAERSVKLNSLQNKIQVLNKDLCNTKEWGRAEIADMVTVNPPYMVPSKGRQSPNKIKMIARQELACTLKDVIGSASYLLKQNGRLVMIHRPERQSEIEKLCPEYNLNIEEIVQIYPKKEAPPSMIVVIAARSPLVKRKDSTLTIYAPDGTYTKQIRQIYNQ